MFLNILEDNMLEETENFTYTGSIKAKKGGTNADFKARVKMMKVAFLWLKTVMHHLTWLSTLSS